jgi:hypothetical protein
VDLLWLLGAAGIAWLLPKTFLAVQLAAGVISLGLFILERSITRPQS